jgi:hypothetical protein
MVKVLDCDIRREGFTHHGQHLNSTGKSKLAQLVVMTYLNYKKGPLELLQILIARPYIVTYSKN